MENRRSTHGHRRYRPEGLRPPKKTLMERIRYISDDALVIDSATSVPMLMDTNTSLLGWMHRKLRQNNNNDVFKELATNGGDEDEEDDYCDGNIDANYSNGVTTEDHDNDVDGAASPTFTCPPPPPEEAVVAVDAIAEKDDDTTTEDDLMVVSAELDKVLGGRNSGTTGDLVASARASFAIGVDCPLQGFLFGSPVSDGKSRQDRRDSVGSGSRRTSLGELFLRTRFTEEKVALIAVEEGEDGEEGGAGNGGKMMKRKVNHEKSANGDGTPASASNKSKFQKILQIFHRKVYPENTAFARSLNKKSRKRGGNHHETSASPKLQCRKEPRLPGFGCCNRPSFGAGVSPDVDDEHNGSKSGHWIRTDADWLPVVA
ncbi:hypothetical protein PR202_gb16073 [Eleusine coracana subsp. coracana]|uniref:Uncharacterized protein n=1 Tax=Eleusine coracana subsp. coracana TaxID=191504 RepID=A0AAV5EZH5_ELECO|nr:hypothetical protein PR202_gb16073 [Eleusine coracana subsp. coracana]